MSVFTVILALTVIVLLFTITAGENELVIAQDGQVAQAQYRYQGKSYQNQFDRPLHFECNARNGEALNQVRSAFHNRYKDRVWNWGCKKAASVPLTDCSWSGHINNWQGPVRFMCPKGKIVTGVDSKHWNSKEDRRWKIKCCSAKGYHTQECELTKQVNGARTYFEHKASPATRNKNTCSRKNRHKEKPDEEVFVGMVSNWRGNDRKWQMIECEFAKDEDKDDKSRDKRKRYHRRRYHGRKHRSHDDTRTRKHCDHGRCDRDKSRSHDKSDDSKSHSHDSSSRSHDTRSRSHDSRSRSHDRSKSSRSHGRSKSSRDKSRSRSHDRSHDSTKSRSRDSRRKCKSCRECNSCGGHE